MIISSALFTTIIQSNYPSRKSWLFSILLKPKPHDFIRKKRGNNAGSQQTLSQKVYTPTTSQKPWRNFWCLTWNVDNFRFWSQRIERIHPILGILIMILQSGILMLIQTKKWILHFLEAGAEFKYSRHDLIFQHVVEITMFKVFWAELRSTAAPFSGPRVTEYSVLSLGVFPGKKTCHAKAAARQASSQESS